MGNLSNLGLTVKKEEDFLEWYNELIRKAELADVRYNIKGFPVYRPWSAITMKRMFAMYEKALEEKGHLPLFFPSLIPEGNLKKEAEHVAGFVPEVFWVTQHGDKEPLDEPLALRPTSETAFYQMYSLWVRSYKDLPLKCYQSNPVWRYETKATKPFFRVREIYWIEAHDAFATEEEAKTQVLEDMKTTEEILLKEFAIPFIFFQRPEWDKFAGAVNTFAADAIMPSGKVSQLPSTHFLGQNFSKAFDVKFTDKDKKEKYAYITCYGPAIIRIYGAMISIHSDNKGLVMPFALAPKQIVIVPILFEETKKKVLKKCEDISQKLGGYNTFVDAREATPGAKFNEWELKGVPIRLEIGPKDMAKNRVTIFRRDLNKKFSVKEKNLLQEIKQIAGTFTGNLLERAQKNFKSCIVKAGTKEELRKTIESRKIAITNFCSIDKAGEKCAEVIEKEIQAMVRGKRVDKIERAEGSCVICGKKASEVVYIARSL